MSLEEQDPFIGRLPPSTTAHGGKSSARPTHAAGPRFGGSHAPGVQQVDLDEDPSFFNQGTGALRECARIPRE